MKCKLKAIELDPKKAKDFLSKNTYEGQRGIRVERVEELRRKIQTNRFHPPEIALAHMNGHSYLMNGQHSLMAIIEEGSSHAGILKEFKCNSKQDVATVFAQFDNGGARSMANFAGAFRAALGIDWPVQTISLCASAISWIELGPAFRHGSSKDERLELFAKHIDELKPIDELIGRSEPKTHSFIKRWSTVAAMIQTLRINKQEAMDFWTKVRDGESIKKTDHEWVLREWLIRSVTVGGNIASGVGRIRTDAVEIYARCIHAWNARRRKMTTIPRFFRASDLPVAV